LKIEKSRVLAKAKDTLKATRENSATFKLCEIEYKALLDHIINELAVLKAIVTLVDNLKFIPEHEEYLATL
jgi:hypothetical protein